VSAGEWENQSFRGSSWRVIFKTFFALPEDGDAFMMQTGVTQKAESILHYPQPILHEENHLCGKQVHSYEWKSTVSHERKSSMLEAGRSSTMIPYVN
jgi:hypothetical protein